MRVQVPRCTRGFRQRTRPWQQDCHRNEELVGEPSITDEDFRRGWADQSLYRHTHGSKHFHHPIVGPLALDYESLTLPADPDQRLSVYPAEAGSGSGSGSGSEEALRLLAAWTRQPETSHGQQPADHETPAGP
ncbi:hypothetical protein ABZ752_00475 [Streptomyces roseifaciens]